MSRRTSGRELDGVLLVDKPQGPTSFEVVKRVERALQARFVLDVHGRLRWMNVQHAELLPVEGGTLRAVHELAFGVIRVEGEEPAWTPALLVR